MRTILPVLLFLVLSGCTPPTIIEHPGENCPPGSFEETPGLSIEGCTKCWAGTCNVYYIHAEDRDHEMAHAFGMAHSTWRNYGKEVCATVIFPGTYMVDGEQYTHRDEMLCN